MLELEEATETTSCLLAETPETNLPGDMQNGREPPNLTDDKLNGISLDERHSSDLSSESSRPRIEQKRSSSITTVKDFLHSTFDNPDLEQIYQNYFSKRRRTSVLFLLAIVIVYNIVLLALACIEYQDSTDSKKILPRICISVIVILILSILFLIYCPRLINMATYSYLPGLLWMVVFVEFVADLLTTLSYGHLEHLASHSVGLYIFFIYVTYSMIKFRLYACVIVASVVTLFHAIAVGVMTESKNESTKLQIVSNLMLFLAANIIGIINYLVTDINQRRSFLETRETVQLKLAVEKEEKNQSRLLQSVLPPHLAKTIIEDMRQDCTVLSENSGFKKIYIQSYEKCSILFADIVGFTEYSSTVTAEELIIMLNELFANFDKLAKRNSCQRIKILGDCYYCISGLDNTDQASDLINHGENSVEMGLAVVEHIKKVRERVKVSCLDMRVGIHSGHVLAGILGQRKWQFDVWSNDVTLANKMESGGVPGRVHVSETTYALLKDSYTVDDGQGYERCQYLKDHNVKTYLIREADSKLIERRRTATLKRNSTLKRKEDYSKKKEQVTTNRGDASPLAKISSAFVRASVRISVDYTADNTSNNMDEFISIGPEVTKDSSTQNGNLMNHDEWKINNLLGNALDNRNSELRDVANLLTLQFKDPEREQEYHGEKKLFCLLSLSTLHICTVFTFIVELILKKGHAVNFITFGVSFFLLTVFWLFTGVGRYSKRIPSWMNFLSEKLHYNYHVRTAVTTVCALMLLGAEVIDTIFTKSALDESYYNPMFYSYNGVLILLVVCTLIQLPYMVRICLLVVTTAAYPLLFFFSIRKLYNTYDSTHRTFHTKVDTPILLTLQFVFYFIALAFHSYQSEITARVLMLWKKEAFENKEGVEGLRSRNEKLMQNILPQHVIDHFLKVENKDETELYSKSYQAVGVIFASIPNFSQFYSEDSINKGGIECMRVLNEIISDFDEVLVEPRFNLIEKIKTVNSCYMAASGLDYNESNSPDIVRGDAWQHLVDLTNFALAIKEKLNEINAESFNNFELRVGISKGPVVAGVIGAKKPHYDIWGNTVNIASRMESTGQSGTIQVLQDTYEILKNRGFEFEERGYVYVKGKGKLLTYILLTQSSYDYTRPQRQLDCKMSKLNKENLQVDK